MRGIQKTQGLLHKTKTYLKRSSPTILTIVSAIGVVATTTLAVKATPKALQIIEENTGYDHDGVIFSPSKTEIVQLTWQCYIPAALVGLSTITCIFGINTLNKRNQASLTSAYALLNESYKYYRKAVNTVYGEDADLKIKAQMAKDTYVSADGYYVYSDDLDPDSEKILCYDLYSQRYFTASMAAVLNAQYHVNRNLCLRGFTNINEFYEFLGIEKVAGGDEIGWSLYELMEDGIMWLDFENSKAILEDGLECCVISSRWSPNMFDCG